MKIIRYSGIVLAVLGLTACSSMGNKFGFFKDETKSYRNVVPVEKTVAIPQNLSAKNMEDYYEIPQAAGEATDAVPPLTPPGNYLQGGSKPMVESQQERIRNAENAKIQGHTFAPANAPKPVGINYNQAWVKVGHVLQGINYKVVEKDRPMGAYYVIDTSATGGKVKKDMPIYQVNLKPSGNGTLVTVTPSNSTLQARLTQSLND